MIVYSLELYSALGQCISLHADNMTSESAEILPEAHPLHDVARRLFQSLRILKPGTLEFIPCTDNWNVEFMRHKKRTCSLCR